MIPFYIFYSMFGFQRTGDQMWAFGDARGRGFLMGATAGRTTLAGEGLQHDDGHSPPPRLDHPDRPRLRPGLRVRAGRDRPRRHRADVRSKAEDVFYYITHLQRELRAAARSPRADRRAGSCAASTGSPRPRRSARTPIRRGWWARARSSSRSSPRATCWPSGSASRPRSTARRRSRCSGATRWRPSAGTGFHPDAEDAARPVRDDRAPAVRGRADRGRHGLDEGAARHGRALAAAPLPVARHRRLRSERHARGPAGAVRDRPAAHRGRDPRRAGALRRARRRPRPRRRSATSASTPTRSTPLAL